MYLLKWFNCKYRDKHSLKVLFKNNKTPMCEICLRSQKMLDDKEKYDRILSKIK